MDEEFWHIHLWHGIALFVIGLFIGVCQRER